MQTVQITFPVKQKPSKDDFLREAARLTGVPLRRIKEVEVLRRSLDARSREALYRYNVDVIMDGDAISDAPTVEEYKDVAKAMPVLIAGAGPAGMFAALRCLQRGLRPVILERGKDVHSRKYDIAAIPREMKLDEDSNYCFGEGGAGTFSDGKLYTRSNKRGDVGAVLRQLVKFGADESILIDAHPHIGSDRLPRIVESIRHFIEEHGGEYHFSSCVTDLRYRGGEWHAITDDADYSARNIILATGHSAKDIYELFVSKGWLLQPKGFALGVRAEHPQSLINDIQYHGRYAQYLPPAEYSLVEQVDGRGVFSFCMCPGGVLVPSSSERGTVVLNGMSNSMRNSRWANAGIVVSVEPEDVKDGADDPLRLLRFQEAVERRAFEVTGSYKAPAQRMTDFVKGKESSTLPPSSYPAGIVSSQLSDILPEFVAERLKRAFPVFGKKMRGYYTSEALLLAVESKTSSTVRIPRDSETLQHPELPHLFPCGEGAGYSGGIVSSAIDGIRCADAIRMTD